MQLLDLNYNDVRAPRHIPKHKGGRYVIEGALAKGDYWLAITPDKAAEISFDIEHNLRPKIDLSPIVLAGADAVSGWQDCLFEGTGRFYQYQLVLELELDAEDKKTVLELNKDRYAMRRSRIGVQSWQDLNIYKVSFKSRLRQITVYTTTDDNFKNKFTLKRKSGKAWNMKNRTTRRNLEVQPTCTPIASRCTGPGCTVVWHR